MLSSVVKSSLYFGNLISNSSHSSSLISSSLQISKPSITRLLPDQNNELNKTLKRGKKLRKPYIEPTKTITTEDEKENQRIGVDQYDYLDWQKDPEELSIISEVLTMGRHVKITTQGRIYSYSSLVINGNARGIAALGYGKGSSASDATIKATADCYKNFNSIYRYQGRTIPHSMIVKNRSSIVLMLANKEGSGVKGCWTLRTIAKAIGLHDVTFKIYRSHNMHNVARAVFKGLTDVTPPEDMAKKMGKKFINVAGYWNPNRDVAYEKKYKPMKY